MEVFRKQQSIACPVTVEGFGYWSGRDVRVEFRPAAPDTGIVFVRRDLHPVVQIAADPTCRIETPRRTTLTQRGVSVEMVEHVMAALWGLAIDNCEVWVDAAEMPGMDGSAQVFVDALDSVGVVELDAVRPQLVIGEVTRIGNDESWIEARPSTAGGLTLKYRLDYGKGNAIGRQTLELPLTPEVFRSELARCRTFMFKEEAEWLVAQGLGTRVKLGDLLVFDETGPIDNELRFPDECVRHKLLDLVGDLALAGCDLVGKVVAHRSGHRLNADLVRVLLAEGQVRRTWRQAG